MDDDESEINPLLRHAAERLAIGWSEAFEELFSRPDAAETIEAYLDDRLHFLLTRNGLLVLAPDQVAR